MSVSNERRYTETYDEWRERVGIMPDQDVREAWEYQQAKVDELFVALNKMIREKEEVIKAKRSLWEDR